MLTHLTDSSQNSLFQDNYYDLSGRGKLADISPTILDFLGLEKPVKMTGNSLLKRKRINYNV